MKDLRGYFRYLPSQESISCCTASSVLLSCEYLFARQNEFKHFSRLFLYYTTRKLQGRINQKGAELGKTLEALAEFGCCHEIDWPFIASRENKEPNMSAFEKASSFKLQEYETLSSINFKEYLEQELPIVIGMNVGRKFLKLSGVLSNQQYSYISESNRFSRGHALTIVGYDDNLQGGSWIVANSMGLKWGDRGFGAISYDANIDIGEAYVIKKFAGKTVDKKISDN